LRELCSVDGGGAFVVMVLLMARAVKSITMGGVVDDDDVGRQVTKQE